MLGVVALEGQGQDELFDILAGSDRPSGGELLVDGRPSRSAIPRTRSGPASSTSPADRAEALLMQRSVRENIALPFTARIRRWGPINLGQERKRVDDGDRHGSRSTPAPRARSAGCRAATSRR